MTAAGVEAVDCVSVDNALARVADPLFAGFCWERSAQCGAHPGSLPQGHVSSGRPFRHTSIACPLFACFCWERSAQCGAPQDHSHKGHIFGERPGRRTSIACPRFAGFWERSGAERCAPLGSHLGACTPETTLFRGFCTSVSCNVHAHTQPLTSLEWFCSAPSGGQSSGSQAYAPLSYQCELTVVVYLPHHGDLAHG